MKILYNVLIETLQILTVTFVIVVSFSNAYLFICLSKFFGNLSVEENNYTLYKISPINNEQNYGQILMILTIL